MVGYWVCDGCLSLNDPRYGACYKCHVRRGEARPTPIIPGASTGQAASEFYGRGGRAFREPSLRLALVVGVIVAVAAIGVWYWLEAGIHFGQGRVAWLVGIVIAIAVVVAGTIAGRRRVSFMLPVISFLLTVAAIVAGEYLIISQALATAAGVDTADAIPIAQLEDVARVVGEYWASDPLRPILWLVAVGAAWLGPWALLAGSDERDPERRDWIRRN